jgi:hypothetical protein
MLISIAHNFGTASFGQTGVFWRLSANSPTAFIPTSLTPQHPQKNQSGQHFWPNLFLGRRLKGLAFQLNCTEH